MKYCTSCGKEIKGNEKFCIHCGESLQGTKHKTKIQIAQIVFILIIFIGIISFSVVFLKQKNQQESEDIILPTKLSDRLIRAIVPESKESDNGVKKEGYAFEIEKPFYEGNYEYDERTVDFRMVCERPCPVPRNILDQEFVAISYAVSTLRGLTQSDFEEHILPFEVHASEDSICPLLPTALAYMSTFVDNNGVERGKLCFFFEELNYNRDKLPYSTSIHEVTHLLESGKIEHNSVIWEGLSEMMESFFLKGNERNSFCWQGNAWYKDIAQNNHDPHWVGGALFFELCNQYGFDYNSLPTLFEEIDKRGEVSIKEFVNIINNIVGRDTSPLFRNAGVDV
ncbi:zinc ribbon domain-containing protein [Candidatus Woesearchaeota archaeon]|nr:zinc ribbon domain-containing protein [Candidatus Woesearchaeota archaeon]